MGVLYPTFVGVVGGVVPPTTYLPESGVPHDSWASAASGFDFGNRFTSDTPFTMRAASYYFGGSSFPPTNFRLWRYDTAVLLATQVTPTPGSGAGWRRVVLDTPVVLSAGVQYLLGLTAESGFSFFGWFSGAPAANSPFTHLDARVQGTFLGPMPTTIPGPPSPFVMMAISLDDAS